MVGLEKETICTTGCPPVCDCRDNTLTRSPKVEFLYRLPECSERGLLARRSLKMLHHTLSRLLLVAFAAVAVAVTPIPDDAMTQLLNQGGVSLAIKAQPMFFFGQAMNRPPCIPTWATTQAGGQTPSSPLCDYPNVGCECVNPDKGIGNPTQRFPIYYSYARCSDTVVRVAYNLFYTKDGAKPKGINGHPYDWERVLVELRRADDTQWRPYQLHLSQHSGYGRVLWPDIQNTFSDDDAGQPRGGDNGRKNLDHPKVYVAWSKHANYQDRNTGWNDPLSQLTNNAFRSQDWWYFPTRDDYIRADRSTDVGRLIASFDWGDASSNPPSVHDGLCTA
ncbi:hypothetical protein JDV02_009104 [Purpureocillium takamizusanense]|uniref:Necrosis inducing protein (NPP1) n=1 Tax=Purpureocillium takamizusanense TaxID=2060973 RepID=A0A9Q8QP85_9HYPO|nr:uncharacterized protein JDV02_009104 [Purpureocillium takamizusanense]UNI23273.1 hypothetical protein JDV02_009104 [Purpureocillium takamizusanense]